MENVKVNFVTFLDIKKRAKKFNELEGFSFFPKYISIDKKNLFVLNAL